MLTELHKDGAHKIIITTPTDEARHLAAVISETLDESITAEAITSMGGGE